MDTSPKTGPMIREIPFSGPIKVFDKKSDTVIFSGTEDTIPVRIALQQPEMVYCVDDTIYIDIRYQRIFHDEEADWYYYESFFREQYEDHSDQEKHDWYHDSFDEYLAETLRYEPVHELT